MKTLKWYILFWSVFLAYAFAYSISWGQSLPQNFEISAGTLLEGFETAGQTDWTYDGTAGGSKSDNTDTTYIKQGSRSLKITAASGASQNGSARKTISQDLSNCGSIGIWVYVEDITLINTVTLYISSNWSASFFSKAPEAGTGNQLANGWNFLTVSKPDWNTTGGELWSNTMTTIRVRVDKDAVAGESSVYFDGWVCQNRTRPKVLFTFDDGAKSVRTNAYQYMLDRDIPGTLYLIGSNLASPTGTQLTVSEIQEMYDSGWDVADHTFDHLNLTTLTQAEIEEQFTLNRAEFQSRGWIRGMYHCAYPNGAFDDTVLAAAEAVGMLSCRSTQNTVGQLNPYNFYPNRLDIVAFNVADGDSVATVTGYVDTAIKQGKILFLLFHNVQNAAGYPIANFQQVVDYVYRRKSQIDAVTITELYEGLYGGRKLRND